MARTGSGFADNICKSFQKMIGRQVDMNTDKIKKSFNKVLVQREKKNFNFVNKTMSWLSQLLHCHLGVWSYLRNIEGCLSVTQQ